MDKNCKKSRVTGKVKFYVNNEIFYCKTGKEYFAFRTVHGDLGANQSCRFQALTGEYSSYIFPNLKSICKVYGEKSFNNVYINDSNRVLFHPAVLADADNYLDEEYCPARPESKINAWILKAIKKPLSYIANLTENDIIGLNGFSQGSDKYSGSVNLVKLIHLRAGKNIVTPISLTNQLQAAVEGPTQTPVDPELVLLPDKLLGFRQEFMTELQNFVIDYHKSFLSGNHSNLDMNDVVEIYDIYEKLLCDHQMVNDISHIKVNGHFMEFVEKLNEKIKAYAESYRTKLFNKQISKDDFKYINEICYMALSVSKKLIVNEIEIK